MDYLGSTKHDTAAMLGYMDGAYPDGEYPFNLYLYRGKSAWYYIAGYAKGTQDRLMRMYKLGKY